MDNFKNIKAFLDNEEGLTVVEYVIGASLLVAAITTIFTTLGTQLDGKLSNIIAGISG
ncbi:Flp family type IVb pilin [Vibrio gallicus]|uniref:Flp family type IVb pilin n=1 Tax=Vibrio gallicus TaxID=190897 RepID=UPI0021C41C46|nr:Flp family type IVb pilin [Vibrio gallicus]